MKATIERATLLKSLGHVQSVVERRNTIPILSNVLLEAREDGSIRLMATDLDLAAVGKLAHDVEQGVRRDSRRARLRDIRWNALVDLKVEIGGHQPDRSILPRLEQDVRQDRDGVPALHDRLDVAEALQECRPLNRRFHASSPHQPTRSGSL